jgi:hypothetical protein
VYLRVFCVVVEFEFLTAAEYLMGMREWIFSFQ